MERGKAIWASSAVAVSLVAASMAYAATNLLAPTNADHVGELKATVERPVQYVYDEVPGSPPAGVTSAAGTVNAQVFDDATQAPVVSPDNDADDDAPDETASSPALASTDESPTTTVVTDSNEPEQEDHAAEDTHEDSHEREVEDD